MPVDWKSDLKSVAPTLGTALRGPLHGAATKTLVDTLDATGKTDATDEKQLSELMVRAMADLGKVAQIRQAEHQFRSQMTELGLNDRALEDIASNQLEYAHRDEAGQNWTQHLLAIAVTIGFFGILISVLKIDIPDKSRDVLNIMLGALGTAWISIVTYYFGSSAGSARKTDLLSHKRP